MTDGVTGIAPTTQTLTPTSLPTLQGVVSVAPSGADFTSIKAAYDSVVAPSSVNRWAVIVYPGVYSESPITLRPYLDLVAVSSRFVTKINAVDPNTALFTTSGAGPMHVKGFSIDGVTNDAAFYCALASTAIEVVDCQIANCQYGFHATTGLIIVENVGTTPTSTMTYMIFADGGNIQAHDCTVQGNGVFAAYAYNDGGNIDMGDITLEGANVTTGLHSVNGGINDMHVFNMAAGTNGIILDGASTLKGMGLLLENGLPNHITVNDVASAIHVTGDMSSDKFLLPTGYTNDIIVFLDQKTGDEGQKVFGELGVGRPEQGRESVFGEGDSYTRGMVVYTYNPSGAVWTDVSVAASSGSGSTFTFPAIALNNAIYFASGLHNGDYLKTPGIKVNTLTAVVLGGGAIVLEYWNGAAWVERTHMSTSSGGNYKTYGEAIFERVQSDQVRFDINTDDAAKNDPMTHGTDYFWHRWRISSGVTTVPIFEQFKLHSNRTEINADGYVEYFGDARIRQKINGFTLGNFQASSSSPANQDVFIGDAGGARIGYGLIENEFQTTLDQIARAQRVSPNTDTSSGVDITFSYFLQAASGAGETVRFAVEWAITRDGDGIVDSTGNTGNTTIQETILDVTVDSAPADIQMTDTIRIGIEGLLPNPEAAFGDILWIEFKRYGSVDSYSSNVILVDISAKYWSWTPGAHV